MPKSMDSLAGRVTSLTLRPLSSAESMGAGFCRLLDDVKASPNDPLTKLPKPAQYTRAEAIDLMVRGGFPEIRTLTDKDRLPRYRSYLDSIIEKDMPILAQVRKPDEFRRFMYQLAARTGSELNSTCSKSASRLMAKSPSRPWQLCFAERAARPFMRYFSTLFLRLHYIGIRWPALAANLQSAGIYSVLRFSGAFS